MDPQDPSPAYPSQQPVNYPINNAPTPELFQPDAPASLPPSRNPSKKKLIVTIAIVVLLLGGSATAWFLIAGKKVDKKAPVQSQDTNAPAKTDKQGILAAVDKYCVQLAKAYGFKGMDSGYIISDRFSESELSDSPGLLRFKQIGNAASATVDCEDNEGPNGLSNDLLFIKENDVWDYKDEVQNGTGGFLCSTLDKYSVSKELAPTCSPTAGTKAQAR